MTRVNSSFGYTLNLREDHGPVVCDLSRAVGQAPSGGTSYCPCFTPGTLIKTDRGEVAVEEITTGTRVLTRDNGYQPVVWTGHRTLGRNLLDAHPDLAPILIERGALGPDLPERGTTVSPQHRMLLSNAQIKRWFDADEVLVAAHLLTCFKGIQRAGVDEVTYIHFMCAQHEIVLADGAWSESYQPRDMRAGAMHEGHRQELLKLFPELANAHEDDLVAARPIIEPSEFVRTVFSGK